MMPDYVIVGAGSAGCVLAARLSENPDVSVALIEAGPPDRNRFIHLPAGFFKMNAGPLVWGYETTPGRAMDERILDYTQARVLGGGSSINAQVFTRGCPEDYDAWLSSKIAPEDLRTLLRPYNERLMEAYAVSRKVNSVKYDTEECIEPIDDDEG